MLADLRDAVRQLRKVPGFTATDHTGTGDRSNHSDCYTRAQVMLKSLPVTKPSELWRIGDKRSLLQLGGYTQGDDGDFALFSWELSPSSRFGVRASS